METPRRTTRSQRGSNPVPPSEMGGNSVIIAAFVDFLRVAADADAHWYAIKAPIEQSKSPEKSMDTTVGLGLTISEGEYLFSVLGLTIKAYNDFLQIVGLIQLKGGKGVRMESSKEQWYNFLKEHQLQDEVEVSHFGPRETFIKLGTRGSKAEKPQARRAVPRFPQLRGRQALFRHRIIKAITISTGVAAVVSPEKATSNNISPATEANVAALPAKASEQSQAESSSKNMHTVLVESVREMMLPLLLEYTVNPILLARTMEKLVDDYRYARNKRLTAILNPTDDDDGNNDTLEPLKKVAPTLSMYGVPVDNSDALESCLHDLYDLHRLSHSNKMPMKCERQAEISNILQSTGRGTKRPHDATVLLKAKRQRDREEALAKELPGTPFASLQSRRQEKMIMINGVGD